MNKKKTNDLTNTRQIRAIRTMELDEQEATLKKQILEQLIITAAVRKYYRLGDEERKGTNQISE